MDFEINDVIDNLYIGCVNPALDKTQLDRFQIKYVLSLGISVPNYDGINYKYMSVLDFPDFNILPHLNRAFEFIDLGRDKSENVYVHCYGGMSRSATIVIAYLMKINKWSYERSYKFLKFKRSCIKPNVGFERQLKRIEHNLIRGEMDFNSNSQQISSWLL